MFIDLVESYTHAVVYISLHYQVFSRKRLHFPTLHNVETFRNEAYHIFWPLRFNLHQLHAINV